jgi:hypothetical protein
MAKQSVMERKDLFGLTLKMPITSTNLTAKQSDEVVLNETSQ